MLQEKSFDTLKSETLHFPNVSSLMKISLGLILFTMLSTVMVYAQTSSDDAVVQITNGDKYTKTTSSISITPYFLLHLIQ